MADYVEKSTAQQAQEVLDDEALAEEVFYIFEPDVILLVISYVLVFQISG